MQKAAQLAWSVLPNALFVLIAVSVFDRVHQPTHKIEVTILGLLSKNMRTIAGRSVVSAMTQTPASGSLTLRTMPPRLLVYDVVATSSGCCELTEVADSIEMAPATVKKPLIALMTDSFRRRPLPVGP